MRWPYEGIRSWDLVSCSCCSGNRSPAVASRHRLTRTLHSAVPEHPPTQTHSLAQHNLDRVLCAAWVVGLEVAGSNRSLLVGCPTLFAGQGARNSGSTVLLGPISSPRLRRLDSVF